MRTSVRLLLAVLALMVVVVAVARSCRPEWRQPIVVGEGRVVVTNLTGKAWTGIEVWLNDYYRIQAPELLPDQRLDMPLRAFMGGYSRPFNAATQSVTGVEVTARAADGQRIRLTYGRVRGR
jgi:hypothetical protein